MLTIGILRGDGAGSLEAPSVVQVGPVGAKAIAIADFDGNGRDDIAAIAGNNVYVLLCK